MFTGLDKPEIYLHWPMSHPSSLLASFKFFSLAVLSSLFIPGASMIDLVLYPFEIFHAAFVFDAFLELFQNPRKLYSNTGLISVKFLHTRGKDSDITLIGIFRVVF